MGRASTRTEMSTNLIVRRGEAMVYALYAVAAILVIANALITRNWRPGHLWVRWAVSLSLLVAIITLISIVNYSRNR